MFKCSIQLRHLLYLIAVFFLVGCGSTSSSSTSVRQQNVPLPSELSQPDYREDNTGIYHSPFTSDEVVTEWVEKAIDAEIGANIGGTVGSLVGQALLGEYAFIGTSIGKDLGEEYGYEQALSAVGGMDFITETSDVSFDSLEALAIYLYRNHSSHPEFVQVVKATMVIYPGLKQVYSGAILNAPRW
jgi:hypothetical protein